jgi:hypothetical protein
LHEAFARLQRLSQKIKERAGPGFVDVYVAGDGQFHLHEVAGAKSLPEFEDELLNVIVWAWSVKDYLKEAARSCGNNPTEIESLANESEELGLISDLANRIKHGNLGKSRSGRFAKLGPISMSIPQSAVGKITVGANRVSTDVVDPDKIKFHAPVLSQDGEVLAEAGECLMEAIKVWETKGLHSATTA